MGAGDGPGIGEGMIDRGHLVMQEIGIALVEMDRASKANA
jgi:hypothetical protein